MRYVVLVWVDGGSAPVQRQSFRHREEAEAVASRLRERIKNQGSTHKVEIQEEEEK